MQDYDDIDDDGAAEVVGVSARRRITKPAEMVEIARAAAGGRLNSGAGGKRDAVVIRKSGQPAVRLTLSHAPVFKAVWAAWSARRVQGCDDPGVSVKDIQARLEQAGQGELTSAVPGSIRSLVKGGAVRATDQHIGYQARRTRYYPTEIGVQAFALAQTLGTGASVQIGAAAASWANRASDAPLTLFEYADLLKGGAALPETA